MDLTPAALAQLRHDPEGLRETARDVLSRPPFTSDQGPVTDVLLRIRTWVAGVLDAVFGTVAGNQVFAWAVVGLATAAVVLLVLRWGRHVRREPDAAASPPVPSRRPATSWLADADERAAAGEWDAAIRCAYLALVTQLAEQGLLEDAQGLTVGEIDRRIAVAAPGRATAVAAAGRSFEDAWYGHRPSDRHGYEVVLAAVDGAPVGAGR